MDLVTFRILIKFSFEIAQIIILYRYRYLHNTTKINHSDGGSKSIRRYYVSFILASLSILGYVKYYTNVTLTIILINNYSNSSLDLERIVSQRWSEIFIYVPTNVFVFTNKLIIFLQEGIHVHIGYIIYRRSITCGRVLYCDYIFYFARKICR